MRSITPFTKLHFGTSGSPSTTLGKGRSAGVAESIRLGLTTQELAFVRGVNTTTEDLARINTLVKQHQFPLTAHGPYYINLNANEPEKVTASINRILATARALNEAGGFSATFHAAYYLGQSPNKVYDTVKKRLLTITKTLREEGNPVRISPETTGKPTQFGHYKELLRLAQDVEGLGICIDFAHLHARENGAYNDQESFRTVINDTETALGREALDNMHIHLSGIAYTEKGEQHHLPLQESDFRWQELLAIWKEYRLKGAVICESPLRERDALLLQKTYHHQTTRGTTP